MTKPISFIDRPIRIALVGCGRIIKNHIKSIILYKAQADLIAICDINNGRLDATDEFIKESYNEVGVNNKETIKYTSYEELLHESKKLELDLIVIATPSGFHSSQVIAAANAGVHVCTEKPMAVRLKDGQEMIEACDKASVRLFVVKQNRFNATLQLVKKQLENSRFGRLSLVTTNVFWHRPQAYYDQAEWRGTCELDGGALMNQASHYVDLLVWMIGPVDSVSASIATISRNIEAEDTAALQLRWRNGALGTMAVTMLTYPKNLEGSITILGEKGSVKIGGPAVNKIEHWEFSDVSEDDQKIKEASYETTSIYGFGHPQFYKNMLDGLQGKGKIVCDGREGLKSLELLTGAYKSAKERNIVYFPLSI